MDDIYPNMICMDDWRDMVLNVIMNATINKLCTGTVWNFKKKKYFHRIINSITCRARAHTHRLNTHANMETKHRWLTRPWDRPVKEPTQSVDINNFAVLENVLLYPLQRDFCPKLGIFRAHNNLCKILHVKARPLSQLISQLAMPDLSTNEVIGWRECRHAEWLFSPPSPLSSLADRS